MSREEHELDPFVKPLVFINKAGFGPTTLPDLGVPNFHPYWKDERLGKVANFGNFQLGQNNQRFGQTRFDEKKALFGNSTATAMPMPIPDDDFELVDTTKNFDSNKSKGPRWNVKRGGFRGGRGMRGGRGGSSRDTFGARGEPPVDPNQPVLKGKQAKFLQQGARRGKQWNKRGGHLGRRRDYGEREMIKEASVKVRSNWEVVEQLDLPQFSKMTGLVPPVTDILQCGELRVFDDALDRITTRNSRPLKLSTDTSFVYAGTLEDPVIESLIEQKQGTVFATDEILSYLMTVPRTVKTWDLIFTRVGDVLFIDKRDDAGLEVLTVNETFTDRIAEKDEPRAKMPYNSAEKLSLEATAVHQSFLCQVLKPDGAKAQTHPNPFTPDDATESPHQPITYKYRSWNLGAHTLVARTEVHTMKAGPSGNVDKEMNVYTLNEYDSKLSGNVDWRQKLDVQKGAVLANELKNNAAKLARWTSQSLMAGVDQMKLGFVSRVSPTDPSRHSVLSVGTFKPRDLALQINLNEKNMWGIVKKIVDLLMNKEPGKYLLVRDPNKPVVRLYKIPMTTFEESEEEEEEEEEEEIDEEDDEAREEED